MIKLSPKYKKLLRSNNKEDHLEGTTAAGKTTIGAFFFILKCIRSHKKFHLLSGLDLGVVEKNIISSELGLLDLYGDELQYFPNGNKDHKLPHLQIRGKVIYVMGYVDQARWKKVLGGQMGCVYIDEVNVANIDYVREVRIRCDYLMTTSNPDNPDLEVYKELINASRPLDEFKRDYPDELLEMLNEPPNKGAVHWYFTFDDNLGLTEEKKEAIKASAAKGTKLYKNKIQGLRGRATGLIFNLEKHHMMSKADAKQKQFVKFTLGIDTSYSRNTEDSFAMIYGGLTFDNEWVILDVMVYNNKNLVTPLTPSDMPIKIDNFLEQNFKEWGFTRDVFIDSADQATILETKKYVLTYGKQYRIYNSYKKTKNVDRINLQSGWMANGKFFLVEETTKEMQKELNLYSWKETKDEPEDRNDHTIQAAQYGWLPYKDKIGK